MFDDILKFKEKVQIFLKNIIFPIKIIRFLVETFFV